MTLFARAHTKLDDLLILVVKRRKPSTLLGAPFMKSYRWILATASYDDIQFTMENAAGPGQPLKKDEHKNSGLNDENNVIRYVINGDTRWWLGRSSLWPGV